MKDLGSHLLDTIFLVWLHNKWELVKLNKFENNSPDHAILISKNNDFYRTRNVITFMEKYFSCQIIGEKGSIHIDSLCKWGPSTFLLRKRKLPRDSI